MNLHDRKGVSWAVHLMKARPRAGRVVLGAAVISTLLMSSAARAAWPPPPSSVCVASRCSPFSASCCPLQDAGGPSQPGAASTPNGCSTCGPSAGDPVDLTTGQETYQPDPDITVYNPSGPDIAFQRIFYSGELQSDFYHPLMALPKGWFSNFDVRMQQIDETATQWRVIYPNTSYDELTLTTDEFDRTYLAPIQDGQPVGKPFVGMVAQDGNSVTLIFEDGSRYTFTRGYTPESESVENVFFLTRIEDRMGNGLHIQRYDQTYTWDEYGSGDAEFDGSDPDLGSKVNRVQYVENDAGTRALVFTHNAFEDENPASGHVSLVREWISGSGFTRKVGYTYYTTVYTPPSHPEHPDPYPPCTIQSLRSVSQIVAGGATGTLPVAAQYDYVGPDATLYGYGPHAGWLSAITVRHPNTGILNAKAVINYNNDRVGSLVDANGHHREYGYDTVSELDLDPTGPSGSPTRNLYGTRVRIFDASDKFGTGQPVGVFVKFRDDFNRFAGFRDAAGNTTYYYHNNLPDTDANGWPIQQGDNNHPTKIVEPDNSYTQYAYDRFGHKIRESNHCGLVTYYEYAYNTFALGRLMRVWQEMRDSGGNVVATRTLSEYTYYEPSGLVHTVTKPAPVGNTGSVTTSYTYNALGDVTRIDAPGNNAVTTRTTQITYDSTPKKGQPRTITEGTGGTTQTTTFEYNIFGQRTSVQDGLGYVTTTVYDAPSGFYNQPTATIYPATGQTGTGQGYVSHTYAFPGGPLKRTDLYDEGNTSTPVRTTNYGYGSEGELLWVSGGTEPASYAYNAMYRRKTLFDGKNQQTNYFYDQSGRLTDVWYPNHNTNPAIPYDKTHYTYDQHGRIWQRTDGRGVVTTYSYTDCGLPETIDYDDATLDVSFGYDDFNRRQTMTDATGSTTYTYDDQDNPYQVTTTFTGMTNGTKTLTYAYWPDGSRKSMATPAGTFNYTYDAVGRPYTVTNPYSETAWWFYYNNGWLYNQQSGGVFTEYNYNGRGLLTGLYNYETWNFNTISAYHGVGYGPMAYDASGNRTGMVADIAYPGTTGYGYDAKDQLLQETSTRNGSATLGYNYDAAGNPTTLRSVPGLPYNLDNQRTGPESFLYDGNGNPTTYRGAALAFDAENRMTTHGSVLSAGYNGDGLRVWKQGTGTGTRTYYLYDGTDLLCELNASGAVTATNTWGANGLVSRRTGSTSVFYAYDPQGNVAQRTDDYGQVLSQDLYDAYGTRRAGNPGNDVYGYNGQWGYYTDVETGLILCTYRYYDPATGRWLTRDPIGYEGGVNLYGYVGGDPVSNADPTGTSWIGKVKDKLRDVFNKKKMAEVGEVCKTAVSYGVPDPASTMAGLVDSNWFCVAIAIKCRYIVFECADDDSPRCQKMMNRCTRWSLKCAENNT